jgi:hypothetical protein
MPPAVLIRLNHLRRFGPGFRVTPDGRMAVILFDAS